MTTTDQQPEPTVVAAVRLPQGHDVAYFADANVVALSDRLDPSEREQALANELCRLAR